MGGSERAEEAETSETLLAIDAVVFARDRAVTGVEASGAGGGTESIRSWELAKVCCRNVLSSAAEVGTVSYEIGPRF